METPEFRNAQHWLVTVERMGEGDCLSGTVPVVFVEGNVPVIAGSHVKFTRDWIDDAELSKAIRMATKDLLHRRRMTDKQRQDGWVGDMIQGITRYPWLINVVPKNKSQLKRIQASL